MPRPRVGQYRQYYNALRAIACMVVDEETNHRDLLALCMAIARQASKEDAEYAKATTSGA